MRFFSQSAIDQNLPHLAVATLLTISLGGLVEIVPLHTLEATLASVEGTRPYSPLELAGRNIYIREGCYVCHSQQIRPFRDEVERYGHYSLAAESIYDHPFQWGSKRTGPDLARVGGKYSNDWQAAHLIAQEVEAKDVGADLETLSIVGVPYTEEMVKEATADIIAQATPDADTA